MNKYVSINVLVKLMHDETQRVFQGTTHKHTWMFYHNALSLMSSKECQQYMDETGMVKQWIMPKQGLNRDCRYEGKVVGDCPEINALDANLNKICIAVSKGGAMHMTILEKQCALKGI